MNASRIVDELKKLSNPEKLAVIEAASRLIRNELTEADGDKDAEDPILKVAGCLSGRPLSALEIDKELYGEG